MKPHKNSDENNKHTPKGFTPAAQLTNLTKDELNESTYVTSPIYPSALEFVDASAVPPSTNDGDVYVLATGGSVNAAWGSASLKDWVKYRNGAWTPVSPAFGTHCYDKTGKATYSFDNTDWVQVGGGDSIYTASGTVPSSVVATLTDNITFDGSGTYIQITNSESASVNGQKLLELNAEHSGAVNGSGGYIDFVSSNGGFNVGRIRNYNFSNFNAGFRFYSYKGDGSTDLGDSWLGQDSFGALIGQNVTSRVGTEDISLQGHTIVKGENTLSSATALGIYDGDTTPNLLWDWRNNGDLHVNQASDINQSGALKFKLPASNAENFIIESTQTSTSSIGYNIYNYPLQTFVNSTNTWWLGNLESSILGDDGDFFLRNATNNDILFRAKDNGNIEIGLSGSAVSVLTDLETGKIDATDDIRLASGNNYSELTLGLNFPRIQVGTLNSNFWFGVADGASGYTTDDGYIKELGGNDYIQFKSGGAMNILSGLEANGNAGLSATYTFGGGSTGDVASMTFTDGILTGVTTNP